MELPGTLKKEELIKIIKMYKMLNKCQVWTRCDCVINLTQNVNM